MKKQVKKDGKVSIASFVLALIKSKSLMKAHGKDAGAVILPQVKKAYPSSKFKQSHVDWYLSRARRQKKMNQPVDHIVQLAPATRKTRKSKGAK